MNASILRVLAVDPASRGVGFSILESPDHLVDWGVRECPNISQRVCLAVLADLITRYQPDVIIVEDCHHRHSRRSPRVRVLIRSIVRYAARQGIRTCQMSRSRIRAAFAAEGAKSKGRIAQAIAARVPELAPRLPPPRRPWESEPYNMPIFTAVALAITFFSVDSKQKAKEQTHDADAG